ncbi:MAG: FAD/NAD(P)-binding protein [archaeon]
MIYMPKKCKVLSVRKLKEDVIFIRVKSKLNPKPGQFLQIYVPNVGECPISNASYSKEHIDFLIRNVGNVTSKLYEIREGDFMFIRGPYGKGYPLHYMENNNIISIGGGCGIAPLKALMEYIKNNRKKFKEIFLFLGFRTSNDILFREDIESWIKDYNVILSVDKTDREWKYSTGLIPNLLEKSGLNNNEKMVLMCGPPLMIKFSIESLKKMGFNDDQIFISMERHMKCGVKKCGHCMIKGRYVCEDGPVFRYDELKDEEA